MKAVERLEDLVPDQENANEGTLRGQQLLDRSLEQHGPARSIVVDRNGVVVAGNKTLEAAVDHGLKARVVQTSGDKLVVVQRMDLDIADAKTRELVYLDNRAAQLGLKWNPAQLEKDLIRGIELGGMFTPDERDTLLADLMTEEVKTTVHFDNADQYAQFMQLVEHVSARCPGSTFGAQLTAWLDEQLHALDPLYEPARSAT